MMMMIFFWRLFVTISSVLSFQDQASCSFVCVLSFMYIVYDCMLTSCLSHSWIRVRFGIALTLGWHHWLNSGSHSPDKKGEKFSPVQDLNINEQNDSVAFSPAVTLCLKAYWKVKAAETIERVHFKLTVLCFCTKLNTGDLIISRLKVTSWSQGSDWIFYQMRIDVFIYVQTEARFNSDEITSLRKRDETSSSETLNLFETEQNDSFKSAKFWLKTKIVITGDDKN